VSRTVACHADVGEGVDESLVRYQVTHYSIVAVQDAGGVPHGRKTGFPEQ
jgi:hypothetical protein